MPDFYVFRSEDRVRGFYATEDGGFGVVGETPDAVQGFLKYNSLGELNLVNGAPEDIGELFPEFEGHRGILDRIKGINVFSTGKYNPTGFLRDYAQSAEPLEHEDYLKCLGIVQVTNESSSFKEKENAANTRDLSAVIKSADRAIKWAQGIIESYQENLATMVANLR